MPRSFAKIAKEQNEPLQAVTDYGEYESKSGIFDQTILCGHHDGYINTHYDKPAYDILGGLAKLNFGLPGSEFSIPNVDTECLIGFFASVLWRASLSRRPEYKHTDIFSRAEEDIRRTVFHLNGLKPSDIAHVCMLRYYNTNFDVSGFYTDPVQLKMLGVRYYAMGLAGFRVIIKLGKPPRDKGLLKYRLNGRTEIRSLVINLEDTPEWKGMLSMTADQILRKEEKAVRSRKRRHLNSTP